MVKNSSNIDDLVDGEVRVTLQVYSGRPDPAWKLPKKKISTLKNKLKHFNPAYEQTGLGYKGFLIESKGVKGVPRQALVYANPYGLERWLLDTAKNNIDSDLKNYVSREILVASYFYRK